MNVQNRKLFVDRGARNRLAEMSGVMASSDALIGEVQKFADGGMAMPRGVPDSPRLSESMVPRVPVATIGGQNFFLSEDGNSIVDERGSVVRDPNILNAVMQQILPPTQPQEGFIPPSMGPTELNTPMGREAARRTAPEDGSQGPSLLDQFAGYDAFGIDAKASGIAALMGATDDEKTALLFPDGNRGVPVVQPSEMGPEFNEFGPEGLAARTAAAERDNQERMGLLAARDTEAERMMGINDPVGSSMEDMSRMRIDEEDRAMATPVPQPLSDIVLPSQAPTPEEVSEPQANTFAGIEDIGLDAREAALQNAGRMSAQEKMLAELSDVDAGDTEGPSILDRFKSFDAFGVDAMARNSALGSSLLGATDSVVSALGGSEFEPQFLGDVPEEVTTTRSEEAADLLDQLQDPNLSDNERLAINSRLSAIDTLYNAAETMESIVPRALDKATEIAAGVAGPLASAFDPKLGANILDNRDAAAARLEIDPVKDLEYEAIVDARNNAVSPASVDTTDKARAARTNSSDPVVTPAPVVDAPVVDAPVGGRTDEEIQGRLTGIANAEGSATEKSGDFANTLLGTEGLGPKETVKAYESKFNEMLGVEDKDKSKEMWNNMAMIGFAIAAGESPNALQNIANGMLAGTKMMKDDKASEQARQDKISMLGLSEANEDRRLDARLRSAERIAGMRSSGGGSNYSSERERSRLKELIYKDAFAFPNLMGEGGALDPKLVNEYLNEAVGSAGPTVQKTQAQAEAEFQRLIKARPEMKEAGLARMKQNGYSTEGLS